LVFLELAWLYPDLKHSNLVNSPEYFLNSFFSDTIILFMGGFVLAQGLVKFGIDSIFANYIIRKSNNSIEKLIFSITFVTGFFSFFLNNTSTTAMMLGFCGPVLGLFELESRTRKRILLSIPFAANIGGIATPIGSIPNIIALQNLSFKGVTISFSKWIYVMTPVVLVLLFFLFGLMKILFYSKESILSEVEIPQHTGQKIKSIGGLFTIIVIFITLMGWLTSDIHKIPVGIISLIPIVLLYGTKILTVKDFNELSWDVLILMGGGLALGKAIEVSGLGTLIVNQFATFFKYPFLIVVALSFVALMLSSFMSNAATANLVIPISLSFQGIVPLPVLVICISIACSMAMPLPISTPPNAMAFSRGGLHTKDMLISGLIISILGYSLLTFWIHMWM
jgi:sodium-dependent dicarboxylate transporter 2/3/5